jgi:chaperone BCS1
MDFSRLHQLGPDFLMSNTTTTSLPSTFLESFVPGYGIISQIILRLFGLDIGLLASGCVILFGLSHAASFCNSYISSYFDRYFTSAVTIDGDDQLYRDVVKWATEQPMTRISRDLRAETKPRGAQYDPEDESDSDDDKSGEQSIFNYGKLANNVPPRYEPNYGIDRFVHGGRTYYLSRERKDKKNPWWGDAWDEIMIIRCNGRSTKPIKDLLLYIRQWNLKNEDQTTNIHRPSPKGDGSGDTRWNRQSNRASRPMRTVSLEKEQKRIIVNDVNEYLQPETRRWYDARGIPYRRGYLFHGPPGTGKTSLSFALAGIFGLDIYCISLSEVGLTEADLNKLFTELPRRCIVLLEDIDSAGLRRDNEPLPEPALPTVSDTKAPPVSEPSGPRKSLISLAGLLNVIDGVASHEGRVLIMTTNHPENLDEALTRPGRVDVRIPFTLATRTQIKDIFMRMYGTDMRKSLSRSQTDAHKHPQNSKRREAKRRDTQSLAGDGEDEDDIEDLLFDKPVSEIVDKAKLRHMAEEYADMLPEGVFSPAAIQGYLLTRKREPQRALDEAYVWREEQLKIMDEKKR